MGEKVSKGDFHKVADEIFSMSMTYNKAGILLIGIVFVSVSARPVNDWRADCELDDENVVLFKTYMTDMIDALMAAYQDMLRGESTDMEFAKTLSVFEYRIQGSLETSSSNVISWISEQETSGLYDKDQLDELREEIESAYNANVDTCGRLHDTLFSDLASKHTDSNLVQTEKEVVALFFQYKKKFLDSLSSLFKDVTKLMSIEFDNLA
ncbi:hypothetical protein HDE_04445 [Halotydeus destructor]|nr:hypothetical protein HDE_04445 [Halotydeus destructor]